MSSLTFFIKPGFAFTPGSWPLGPHTWAAGLFPFVAQLCPLEQKFGVGIQSSRGAALSKSHLEKVVHSKCSLTQREAGKEAVWL